MTLAERWNGTAWTIQSTPNPTGAQQQPPDGDLVHVRDGVHRGRVLRATATPDRVTLAERWNGTSWTIQPTPSPPGAHSSDLTGISCTSATACTAVGNYTTPATALS